MVGLASNFISSQHSHHPSTALPLAWAKNGEEHRQSRNSRRKGGGGEG